MNRRVIAGLVGFASLMTVFPAAAASNSPPSHPGVILSRREREAARPVRLPDGRVVYQAGNSGIPWLYGLGDAYGRASADPLVGGVTPSIIDSTPSRGIVPGQEPD
ncbi:hypothetical protein [Jiella sp. M17.18]|uniref:hypothetical protein n=1 Tax=Jiella sp. M17.18 TaxID=3234247 RepID=UPI0034DEAA13